MAVLPNFVHENPNTSSIVIGGVAGGIAYGIFEQDPFTSTLIGVGGALLGRGLIHVDEDSTDIKVGKSKIVVAERGNMLRISGDIAKNDTEALAILDRIKAPVPAPAWAQAIHAATGGNPQAIHDLLARLDMLNRLASTVAPEPASTVAPEPAAAPVCPLPHKKAAAAA